MSNSVPSGSAVYTMGSFRWDNTCGGQPADDAALPNINCGQFNNHILPSSSGACISDQVQRCSRFPEAGYDRSFEINRDPWKTVCGYLRRHNFTTNCSVEPLQHYKQGPPASLEHTFLDAVRLGNSISNCEKQIESELLSSLRVGYCNFETGTCIPEQCAFRVLNDSQSVAFQGPTFFKSGENFFYVPSGITTVLDILTVFSHADGSCENPFGQSVFDEFEGAIKVPSVMMDPYFNQKTWVIKEEHLLQPPVTSSSTEVECTPLWLSVVLAMLVAIFCPFLRKVSDILSNG